MVEKASIAAKVCAVVVTYFPDADVLKRARVIAGQVGAVVVVDNGSGAVHDDTLRRLAQIPILTLLRDDTNLGLAGALSQGLRWAQDHGYGWALMFDLDSVPLEYIVEELGRVCVKLGKASRATLVGSNFGDVNSGKASLNSADFPNQDRIDYMPMQTSGTLIPLELFDAVGPFRSDLFVDLVDMEYALSSRSRGFNVIMTVRPLMLHAVGARKGHRLLWRTVWPSNHSHLRRHFTYCNLVHLLREYSRFDPVWAFPVTVAFSKEVVLISLFEEHKRLKLTYITRGIRNGLKGISGNDPPFVSGVLQMQIGFDKDATDRVRLFTRILPDRPDGEHLKRKLMRMKNR